MIKKDELIKFTIESLNHDYAGMILQDHHDLDYLSDIVSERLKEVNPSKHNEVITDLNVGFMIIIGIQLLLILILLAALIFTIFN